MKDGVKFRLNDEFYGSNRMDFEYNFLDCNYG